MTRVTTIERDNPFLPGGEFDKEAADILRVSTISADKVHIVDPSSPQIHCRISKDASSTPDSETNGLSDSTTTPEKTSPEIPDTPKPEEDNSAVKESTTPETNGGQQENKKDKKKKKKGCEIL